MTTPTIEADLKRYCAEASPDALGRVFDTVASGLLCVASQLSLGNEEDILQETFVTTIKQRARPAIGSRTYCAWQICASLSTIQ